jgi:DNA-binding NarL/FixJ family response regulator
VCDVEAAGAAVGRATVDPLDEWSQIARRAQHVDLVLAAYARLRGAETALAHKDRRATTVALSTALRDLAPAGGTFVGAQIEHLALVHHLALPPDGGPDEQPRGSLALGLTRRETEVLGMLVEGASNRQIGRALGITEKTASVHVSRVITKLGVSTRLEAAARAHRERLL